MAKPAARSRGPDRGGNPAEDADSLAWSSLEHQAKMLVTGEVSSRELVELSLARIEAAQRVLNPFRVVCAEQALQAAADSDRRLAAGAGAPLLGVPVAIKDDVDLVGHPTPFGCAGEHPPAERDAEVVRRLKAAGAVVVGKTNAPEVGQWHFTETRAFGITRNPWSTDHAPGGSSGGAAVAVAAGLVAGAVGSDGAGSIRIPAAWTGLVGLKPQRGRVSTWPDPEAFNGLTCYGPLARDARDAALLLDVLHGNVPGDLHKVRPPERPFADAATAAPQPMRIALSFATPFGAPDKIDDEHRAATEKLARQLSELGHEVEEADPDYGLVGAMIVPRGMAGVSQWLSDNVDDRSVLDPRTRSHANVGRLLGGLPLRLARAGEGPLRRRVGRVFERFDAVLTPTTAQPPPEIGGLDGRGYWATSTQAGATCPFGWPWNVVGWPAISVPAGFTSTGLPIGAQLAGHYCQEATLLALAAQLDASRSEILRPPASSA